MTTILSSFDLNELMPFVILFVVWYMVLFQIRKGLKHGVMDEHRRSSSESVEPNTRTTTKKDEPWNFRFLFAFYVILAFLVPILTVAAVLSKTGIIAWPYNK